MKKDIRILLTGAGSGGHVFPLIAVARELVREAIEKQVVLELHYLGPEDRWTKILAEENVRMHRIPAAKLRRYAAGMGANLLDVPKFIGALILAFFKMFWLMPDAVLSKGGPGALPVVLTAWFFRVPVLVHDSDAQPGVTTLLSARFAKKIAVSFDAAAKFFPAKKVILTGNPVRTGLVPDMKPELAKQALGFDPQMPLLLVLGGSQGSTRINEFLVLNLKGIISAAQVLHQTGADNFTDTDKLARAALSEVAVAAEAKTRYKAVPFLEKDYGTALAAADLVAGRAGASTIFECAAAGKPAILVPLPESANDHQRANAYAFAETGAGAVIEEANLLPGIFVRELTAILGDKERYQKMQTAAKAFFRPDAAKRLAETLWELAV